ncbi:hypothetical protein V1524DRAFT_442623 [Lipomyces starkeyi]
MGMGSNPPRLPLPSQKSRTLSLKQSACLKIPGFTEQIVSIGINLFLKILMPSFSATPYGVTSTLSILNCFCHERLNRGIIALCALICLTHLYFMIP